MPKIITAKRLEGEVEKARDYVRSHILFPSALLGLISLLTGAAALVYQFFTEAYSWRTLGETTALLLLGSTLGWAQTRYHRYLLREHPGHFAARMKVFTRTPHRRAKREILPSLEHQGRGVVPLLYLLGIGVLVGASVLSSTAGHVYYMAAFLLPWAGFFWAKTFFWRGVLPQGKS